MPLIPQKWYGHGEDQNEIIMLNPPMSTSHRHVPHNLFIFFEKKKTHYILSTKILVTLIHSFI
jgi:hypothetical protein